ncbi:hypothetical protein BSR29_00680 [Boudabousia liubingyangii]|uniref:Uncharacterized protein n=1 Tax=Boudabousia liubingyangii TaxID=1921764 RepID=A0A1Q5PPX9_9ACTO|nr:hypothetical protein [Boudabousia liubingyangii]OKL49510.1 hypothetical protein BSR29_00680 [Boudabousia liubingyangii]
MSTLRTLGVSVIAISLSSSLIAFAKLNRIQAKVQNQTENAALEQACQSQFQPLKTTCENIAKQHPELKINTCEQIPWPGQENLVLNLKTSQNTSLMGYQIELNAQAKALCLAPSPEANLKKVTQHPGWSADPSPEPDSEVDEPPPPGPKAHSDSHT